LGTRARVATLSVMRTLVATSILLTTLTFGPSAWCDDDEAPSAPAPPAPPPPTTSRWYGWQVLLVDGAAVLAGAATENLPVTLGVYALGAPIVHAAHGRGGAALGSFGLRLALPLVAGGVMYALTDRRCGEGSGDWCGLGSVIYGILGAGAGMITASLFDAFAIARESVPSARATAARKPFTLTPSAHVDPRGDVMVGAFGSF
jgi:hypothetical protein